MPKAATMENSKAAVGYGFYNRLFEIERELERLSSEDRQLQRQLRSKTFVEEYYAWLDTRFQPSGKLKPCLCAFLEHSEIEISNSQVENTIRPLVVGRKNWFFSDTSEGAEASAIAFSLIETATANGLNVERYLLHIHNILPDCFAVNSDADIRDLLPWLNDMKTQFSLRCR